MIAGEFATEHVKTRAEPISEAAAGAMLKLLNHAKWDADGECLGDDCGQCAITKLTDALYAHLEKIKGGG